jgi:hypothetical protein
MPDGVPRLTCRNPTEPYHAGQLRTCMDVLLILRPEVRILPGAPCDVEA